MTLRTKFSLGAAGVMAVVGSLVGLASLATAAVAPTVTPVIQNGSNITITTAAVGTGVHASVTVASTSATSSPTGTVDFSLYSNQSCSGSPVMQSGVALVNGAATSSTTTVPIGGLSYKVHYSGQTDVYTATDSGCVLIGATQLAPTLGLSLSSSTVQAGNFVNAIPSLVGETGDAGGSLQYNVFSNNTCTTLALNAGSKTVLNGSTTNSDSWQFITPGTYYWQGVYSGDASNVAATSSCTGAILTVIATSTPTTTPPTGGPGTISGNIFNDQNGNDVKDGSEPNLAGWTVWLHKAATSTHSWWSWGNHDGNNDPVVATAVSDANGNYSFGNLSAGQYFVEESVMSGWKQTSSDTKVTLTEAIVSATVNFADMQISTTSGNGKHDGDNENEGNDDHATSTDHGNNGNGDNDNEGNDDHATGTDHGNNGKGVGQGGWPGNSFFGHFHKTFDGWFKGKGKGGNN